MPPSSRGSQYIGNAHAFLSCRVNHEKLADDLYSQMFEEGKPFGETTCESCGAYITVSLRGIEWETKIFSRGPSKERC
jgi:hypothetical protein